MKSLSFRPPFLLLSLLVGLSMPSSNLAEDPQCTLQQQQQTPDDALGPFYVANSSATSLMGPGALLMDPARRLEVKGRVLSSLVVDCNSSGNAPAVGLSGVTVEVWYAGDPDENGNYYQDEEYRGQVVTDECGYYAFSQAFPALYPMRPILHDHFRLSREGEELLVTQMYFYGESENQTAQGYVAPDNTAREMQAVSIVQDDDDGARSVEFDMYVDLEGDGGSNGAACQDDSSEEPAPVSSVEQQLENKTSDASLSSYVSSHYYTPSVAGLLLSILWIFI